MEVLECRSSWFSLKKCPLNMCCATLPPNFSTLEVCRIPKKFENHCFSETINCQQSGAHFNLVPNNSAILLREDGNLLRKWDYVKAPTAATRRLFCFGNDAWCMRINIKATKKILNLYLVSFIVYEHRIWEKLSWLIFALYCMKIFSFPTEELVINKKYRSLRSCFNSLVHI